MFIKFQIPNTKLQTNSKYKIQITEFVRGVQFVIRGHREASLFGKSLVDFV
jgi:hypothetical protein